VKRGFAITCALLMGAISTDARSVNGDVDVNVTLRDTGYLLGDLIDERIELRLPGSMRIDPDSLPLPGRVTPWLEVRRTSLGPRAASGAQELIVTYQIFAVAEQATRAALPEFKLKASDGAQVRAVSVPARMFLLSPALPPTLTDEDRELRPSPPPMALAQTGHIVGALLSLALALASAVYLLWRYDRLPFWPYAPGPLARTWRRWRRKPEQDLSSTEQAALLRDMHAALNRSAGETLYPSTLERLFERAPYLMPLRERIETLFGASWNSFYGSGGSVSFPAAGALALLHDAADRERRVPC
jgi:mxaA protein